MAAATLNGPIRNTGVPSSPSDVASSLLRLMSAAISAPMRREIGVELRQVDAGVFYRVAHLIGGAAAFERHHGGVGGLVFVLILGGEREFGAVDAGLGEDRPVLVDKLYMAVVGDDLGERGRRLLAERAVVIEEGDDGDVALGVAANRGGGIVEISSTFTSGAAAAMAGASAA